MAQHSNSQIKKYVLLYLWHLNYGILLLILCSSLLYSTLLFYSTLLYTTPLYSTRLYSTLLYSTQLNSTSSLLSFPSFSNRFSSSPPIILQPVAYSVELLIELLDVLQSAFGPAFDYLTLSPTGNSQPYSNSNSNNSNGTVNNVSNGNARNIFSISHSTSNDNNDNNEKRKQTSRRTSFVDYFTKSSRSLSESRTSSYDSYNTTPPVPTTSTTSFWFPTTPSPSADKNTNKNKKFFSQDSGDFRYNNNKINSKVINSNNHIDSKSRINNEVEVDLLTIDVQSPQAVKVFFNILTSKAFSSFESKIAQLQVRLLN